MKEIIYNWKIKGLFKGIDPDAAVNELSRIQNTFGKLTPEIIVTEAYDSKSPIHHCFEWNNEKAAYNYRLQQARVLLNNIEITTISSGKTHNIDVFEVVSSPNGYKHIQTFTPEDVDFIRQSTKRQIDSLRSKLSNYNEFKVTTKFLQKASSSLDDSLEENKNKRKQPIDLFIKN